MNRIVLIAALVAFVAGCSTNNAKTALADDDEKTPVTGSHLPSKDRTTVKATTDRTQIDNMMRQGQQTMPAKGTN
jgi:Ni/Co efflux regulator RcnB